MVPVMTPLGGCTVRTVRLVVANDAPLPGVADEAAARWVRGELGVGWPEGPGEYSGGGPWCIWVGPLERMVVGLAQHGVGGALAFSSPGADTVCAIDLSEAVGVWRLQGEEHAELLSRLADVGSIPAPGRATRLRWGDVPVVLVRLSGTESLVLAEAALGPYLVAWWAYAVEGSGARCGTS
jgi:hypothetical protein